MRIGSVLADFLSFLKRKVGLSGKVRIEKKLRIEPMQLGNTVVEMKGITKIFPGVVANDHVNFDIKAGEIHALLGENGAGKTTLMNILYGLLQPDEGDIYVMGTKVVLKSPKDAIDLGIGMVHQHFTLVSAFTVTENVILGLKSPKEPLLSTDLAEKKIIEISEKFGLKIDSKAKIWQLSVGEQQRVEIVKALYRDARVLILDEPTSILTPQEVKELMEILKHMAKKGLGVIPFITHKLSEVMAVSNRVTVLKRGKVVSTITTNQTNRRDLARKMVDREVVFGYEKISNRSNKEILRIEELQSFGDKGLLAVKDVSLSVHEGEILGIAGVAGNGQREMVEVITGLRKATGGKVLIEKTNLTNRSPKEILESGINHIPEDRMVRGIIPNFSIAENVILELHGKPPFAKRLLLNYDNIERYAKKLVSEFNIVTPNIATRAKNLSGGNIQRLILARELSQRPKLLIAVQPTKGLDVAATDFIHQKLIEQRNKGTAILLVSEDLDEVMTLSDRIAVIYEGKIIGTVNAAEARLEEIGLMMAGTVA